MKASTYKKLLGFSVLSLILLLWIGGYVRPNLKVVKSVGSSASWMSSNSGFFSGLFSHIDHKQEIHPKSIEMINRNIIWHGKSLDSHVRGSKSSFWLEADVASLRKELVTGGLNLVQMSKFPMDEYMESWEWDILRKPALNVAMDAGNGITSSMVIINRKSIYRVGDFITVRVDIRDGHGRQKKDGGDQVRVWIVDTMNQASQASEVTDMGNGSYISAFPLSWAGTVNIKASLMYNTDIQRAYFFIRNVAKTTRFMAAGFKSDYSSEATLCSPFPVSPSSKHLCNFTNENGGVPWYCGRPRNPGLECRHWKYNFDIPFWSPLPLTPAENEWSESIRKSKHRRLSDIVIEVAFKTAMGHQPSKARCGSLPLNHSWTNTAPRGFFKNKVWNPSSCTLPLMSKAATINCLKNTTFIMLGDSNLRLAFQILTGRIPCKLNSGVVKSRWHKPLSCFSETTHTSIHWNPHGLPFHLGNESKPADRHNVKHAHESINEIPSQGRFIILIHLYFHFTPHHYSVFRTVIRSLRRSVEKLFQRNPEVKVILRGPHAATKYHEWYGVRAGDLAGTHYIDMIRREFKGLYDKIFFLLPWDMTVAIENVDFHPPDYVNQILMNLVLDYACWDQ